MCISDCHVLGVSKLSVIFTAELLLSDEETYGKESFGLTNYPI